MKKIISILMAAVLLLTLAGCNGGKQEPVIDDKKDKNGDYVVFENVTSSFYKDSNTELVNVVLGVYPVDETKAVFQFDYYEAGKSEEMSTETVFPFTFTKTGDSEFTHTETDQNGDPVTIVASMDSEGAVTVTSDVTFSRDISGRYSASTGKAETAAVTLVEYLRNIPKAEIGDFGRFNPYDEIDETLISGWLHDIVLTREGEFFKRFIVADDFSVIGQINENSDDSESDCRIISGSAENILNHEETYEFLNEDENTSETFTQSIVYPYLTDGTELVAGTITYLEVAAPWDLIDSVTFESSNTDVISKEYDYLRANAAGEAVIKVSIVYGGFEKKYEINVSVVEADENSMNSVMDLTEAGEKLYFGTNGDERASMTICEDDGMYVVEIHWSDSASSGCDWSYLGQALDSSENEIILNGTFTEYEYYSDDECHEEVYVSEGATLSLDDEGMYHWHVDNGEVVFAPAAE